MWRRKWSWVDPTGIALLLEAAAVRLATGRGAIDVAAGETLLRLFEGDRLLQLGSARRVDYARERLGIPARTMYFLARLARELARRPLLRRAVMCGAVSPQKALAVAPLAIGEEEAAWTAAAMRRTLADLKASVRGRGRAPPVEEFEVETLRLRMDAAQQDRLDAAISLAREIIGAGAPRWQCVEAICQEWIGGCGEFVPEGPIEGARASPDEPSPVGPSPVGPSPVELRTEEVSRQLAALEEAHASAPVGGPEGEGADAFGLDARLLRLLAARREFDVPFGAMLAAVVKGGVWSRVGYRTFEEWCAERLGIGARTARERLWLERRMCALPELREALAAGRITFSKALLVARGATPADIGARIEEATSTTWQRVERESTAEEDRRNRARGVRRLWGPKDASETLALAISAAQAWVESRGERIGAGEALALIADHFVLVWSASVKRHRIARDRREVLRRHGGLCAVPGCSRAAEHDHHIRFRSLGGSDDPANRAGLCAPHHLRGVHRGRIEIRGNAEERLVFRLGTARGGALEEWVQEGGEDLRRVS